MELRMQALKEFKTKSQDPGKAFLLGERVKQNFAELVNGIDHE